MTKPILALLACGLVAACATQEPLYAYRPVVDPGRTDMARFENDLVACRNVAMQLEAEQNQRTNAQRGGNVLAGAVTGAALGALLGTGSGNQGNLIKAGVAAGAVSGAVADDDPGNMQPRRVVDRCMQQRGHVLLNDAGRG